MTPSLLETLTTLSHEFGSTDYVRGGGGNTSVKDFTTLWVKPSGMTLKDIRPTSFIGMDRARLAQIYTVEVPTDPSEREVLIKDTMARAILPETPGRASVEAPLHESFSARYVVHTHPALVNGMTCAQDGAAVCRQLFPEALWVDYMDPGFSLCVEIRRHILRYKQQRGKEPSVIFLQNHGIFVAADTPEGIHAQYHTILDRLLHQYRQAQIPTELIITSPKPGDKVTRIQQTLGQAGVFVTYTTGFDYAEGPVSPDHIVYAKSYPLVGEPTPQRLQAYEQTYGYTPWVVVWDNIVFAVGTTQRKAQLALEMTREGALIKQLARAFGGIRFLSERESQFIENWEAEHYRRKIF